MANKIAVVCDSITILLNAMKLGVPGKTEVHNESKTVRAISLRFTFSNPVYSATIPAYRKNSIFIITG